MYYKLLTMGFCACILEPIQIMTSIGAKLMNVCSYLQLVLSQFLLGSQLTVLKFWQNITMHSHHV